MNNENLVERVESLEQELKNLKDRLNKMESSDVIQDRDKPKSLAEFKLDYSPSTNYERALVIGKYFETHGKQRNFTSQDIEEGFRKCKWKPPANPSDTIGKAAGNKGWFFEDSTTEDGNILWRVTETGEQYLSESIHDEQ